MPDTIKTTLDRMSIDAGDVLLVTVDAADDLLNVGQRLQKELREWGYQNLVIVTYPGSTVEKLDPDTMAVHGWYRKATQTTPA
jgi:hypothetical protein